MSRPPPPPPPPLPPQKLSVFVPPIKSSSGSIESELMSRVMKSEDRSIDCATSLFGYEIEENTISYTICSICKSQVKNQLAHSNSHATQILPWLFLGSKENSSNISELQFCRIDSIMNCTSEISNSFTNELEYYTFPITGGSDNIPLFVDSSLMLENLRMENKKVLVHCVQGVNRAAGVIIYYLMAFSGMPFRDAYFYLKSKRTIIRLKRYIVEELVKMEKNLYGIGSLDVFELCEDDND